VPCRIEEGASLVTFVEIIYTTYVEAGFTMMLGITWLRSLALVGATAPRLSFTGLGMIRWRCPLCNEDIVAVSCQALLTVIYYHLLSEHAELLNLERERRDIL